MDMLLRKSGITGGEVMRYPACPWLSLDVTSRVIIRPFFEEFRFLAIPVLERVDWGAALEHGLRELAVVKADVAQDGLFQVFAAAEAVALQDVLDPAVEPLHHSVGLWPHRRGEAVFDVEVRAEAVEIMVTGRGATAQVKEAVSELLAVARRENGLPTGYGHARSPQIAQETPGVGRRLRWINAHEDPTGGAVNGNEQIPAATLVRHLRQVFDVDMQVTGLVGLELLVGGPQRGRLQIAQIAHAMPTKASIQPRARDVRVQELADNGQQIVERQ